MTQDEFVNEVAERIEKTIMRAQGIGDGFMADETPDEVARSIARLVPSYAFSEPDDDNAEDRDTDEQAQWVAKPLV